MSRDFEIVDGVYKGPRHYSGSLDLRGTSVSDLGSLKSVGGSLSLSGTSVSDLGSLESVGGGLYLVGSAGSAVTSLGSLKSVGGGLSLLGTSVSDLGSLKSVGGFLDLMGTDITSLGCLENVGGGIYTDDYDPYSFQDLKALVQKIEDSSIVTLVEMLPVEKNPFLKRVIERRLQGV